MSSEPSLPPVPPDDTPGSLVSNTSALMASRLLVAALGWAGTVLIVRALTPEQWGQFAFVFSLLGLLSVVTDLGASRIVLSELGKPGVDQGGFAGQYVLLRAALGLLAYLVAVAFVVVARYPAEVVVATAVAGLISIVASFSSGLDVVFQSRLRLGVVATASVVGQVVQLGATVLVALIDPTLLLFIVPAILYDVVAGAIKLRRVRRIVVLRYGVDRRTWWFILRQAAPLALIGLVTAVGGRIDVIVLSWLDTFEAVGAYSVALKFSMIVVFIPSALAAPLLTLLVRSWPDHRHEFAGALRQGLSLLVLAAGMVLVSFLPVAANVVSLLYGSEYADVALAAQLSVTATCVSFVAYLAAGLFVAQERYRDYLLVMCIGLVLSVVGNLVLVPVMSYDGSALAHLVRELVVLAIIGAILIRQRHVVHLQLGQQVRVLVATLAGLLVGFGLVRVAPWPVAAAGAVATYVGLLELLHATGPGGLRGAVRDVMRARAEPEDQA